MSEAPVRRESLRRLGRVHARMRRQLASPPPLVPGLPSQALRPARIVARGKADRVRRIGLRRARFGDLYHRMLIMPFWALVLLGMGFYLTINTLFALLYMLDPDGVAEMHRGSFADAFFFSIQTMATIGYGQLWPRSTYANVIVTIETMVALLVVALSTGVVFARVSRPTARVMFSHVALIGPREGLPTLFVRMGNERHNQILEADVALVLIRNEVSAEGMFMRRFHDLPLARAHTPIFALSFTAMHPIDESSPLFGATRASLEAASAELLVTVTGMDETMSQTIHARYSYLPSEILFDHHFADLFGYTEDGMLAIDYRRFHDAIPAGQSDQAAAR